MRRTAAVAALVVAVAVAGCSDEAEPSTLPPVETKSPASASPSDPPASRVAPSAVATVAESSPASVPAIATAATPQGASTFARHYIAVLQTALATGETAGLRRLTDPGCGGCAALMSAIDTARAAGQRVDGGAFVVEFAEAPALEAGETTVALRYTREPGRLVTMTGAVVSEIAAEGPVDAEMRIKRLQDSWQVLGFRQVPG